MTPLLYQSGLEEAERRFGGEAGFAMISSFKLIDLKRGSHRFPFPSLVKPKKYSAPRSKSSLPLESVGTRGSFAHTVKLLPQPQVDLAFGLRMTNCAPCRLSR